MTSQISGPTSPSEEAPHPHSKFQFATLFCHPNDPESKHTSRNLNFPKHTPGSSQPSRICGCVRRSSIDKFAGIFFYLFSADVSSGDTRSAPAPTGSQAVVLRRRANDSSIFSKASENQILYQSSIVFIVLCACSGDLLLLFVVEKSPQCLPAKSCELLLSSVQYAPLKHNSSPSQLTKRRAAPYTPKNILDTILARQIYYTTANNQLTSVLNTREGICCSDAEAVRKFPSAARGHNTATIASRNHGTTPPATASTDHRSDRPIWFPRPSEIFICSNQLRQSLFA
ncbi:hypothetical protein ABKN59_006455 [Abortiporus biennis]